MPRARYRVPAPNPGRTMDELTPKQQQIFDFIRQSIERSGLPPTRSEMKALISCPPSAGNRAFSARQLSMSRLTRNPIRILLSRAA